MDKLYGEGVWGLDEVYQDMVRNRTVRVDAVRVAKTKHRRTVEMRVKEYLSTFQDPTPNDVQSLNSMSNLEVQMEGIEDELLGENLRVDDRKKLGELYARLSAEHRQLQTALGIIRSDRESEMDMAAEFKRLIQGAKQKISEEGIRITCPHCFEKMALAQGLILFHYKVNVKWKWESQCPNPKCKKWIVLKSEEFDLPEGVEPRSVSQPPLVLPA
jgi:hypothetical protein